MYANSQLFIINTELYYSYDLFNNFPIKFKYPKETLKPVDRIYL